MRVIDFERALATLDPAQQSALILTYRDRQGHAATALGRSVRTLAYMLPAARRRLADVSTASTCSDPSRSPEFPTKAALSMDAAGENIPRMRKVIIELVVLAVAVALTAEIIKSWIPFLPWIWLIVLTHWTWEALKSEQVRVWAARQRKEKGPMSFVVVAALGASLFVFYWWSLNALLAPKIAAYETEQTKSAAPPVPHPETTTPVAPLEPHQDSQQPDKKVEVTKTHADAPHKQTQSTPLTDTLPDLTASIVNPSSIALEYMNNSNAIVRDLRSLIMIWDLDNLPADNLPLPMANTLTTDLFLHPKTYSMPFPIAGDPRNQPLIKKGDRLFGIYTATCPDCANNRGYWVYAIAGEGGWYSPWEPNRHPQPSDLLKKIREIAANSDAFLDYCVPNKSKRIPIKEQSF